MRNIEESQVRKLRAWFEKDGPEVERIWSFEVLALCDSWLAQVGLEAGLPHEATPRRRFVRRIPR